MDPSHPVVALGQLKFQTFPGPLLLSRPKAFEGLESKVLAASVDVQKLHQSNYTFRPFLGACLLAGSKPAAAQELISAGRQNSVNLAGKRL